MTPHPTIPTQQDPENFPDDIDAFNAWMGVHADELDANVGLFSLSVFSTSTTSLTVGAGTKNLVVQPGKGYGPSMFVTIGSTASPTNYMIGQVVDYDDATGDLEVTVTTPGGSGTFAAWTITPALSPNLTSLTLTNVTLAGSITEIDYALSTTTPVIEADNGFVQAWTLTGNSTPTESISENQAVLLVIDDGTAYTINWSSVAVTWKTDGGSAPTLNTSGPTFVLLVKIGTTVYGFRLGNA